MGYIHEILKKENVSIEELLSCFEKIREEGNTAVMKLDGERLENPYTVFITFSGNKKGMIRADESDLKIALIKVLTEYIS